MFIRITIDDKHNFTTKVVHKANDIAKGMMGATFNDDKFSAMLFVCKGHKQCFFMKNCIIPLDMVFISMKTNTITKIYHNCPPCTGDPCKTYCAPGEFVLEVHGGTCKKLGIRDGHKLELFTA